MKRLNLLASIIIHNSKEIINFSNLRVLSIRVIARFICAEVIIIRTFLLVARYAMFIPFALRDTRGMFISIREAMEWKEQVHVSSLKDGHLWKNSLVQLCNDLKWRGHCTIVLSHSLRWKEDHNDEGSVGIRTRNGIIPTIYSISESNAYSS